MYVYVSLKLFTVSVLVQYIYIGIGKNMVEHYGPDHGRSSAYKNHRVGSIDLI